MIDKPVEIEIIYRSMDHRSEKERLEAIRAAQDLLASESVDISQNLNGNEDNVRFENPATNVEIRQRE